MKSIGLMAAFAVLSAFSVRAEWTYDAGAKTITDGFWTLTVTAVSGTDLTVTGLTGSAAEGGEEGRAIDLTEVKDGAGVSYRVVNFGGFSGQNSTKSTLWARKDILTEFIAPHCSEIGQYAFNKCTNLTKVELNKEVAVSLGGASFDGCIALERLEPRKIKSAGVYLFQNCKKLSGEIELISENNVVGQQAFSGSAIERVTGLNTASIQQKAFSSCTSLKSVNFPKVTTIPYQAFLNCSSLEEVSFPAVTEIVHQSFSNCVRLDADDLKVLLGPQLIKLGQIKSGVFYGDCFNGCTGIKGTIVWDLPNLATNAVPPNFFSGCSGISRVEFKTPVCDIGGKAFSGISPGAEIYLGRSQIKVFGQDAIGTTASPYPKIFVRNFDEGLISAMEKKNVTLREKDFRNTQWVSPLGSAYTHGWTAVKMYKDNTVCEKITIGTVSYPSPIINRVHAFVAWGHCCWVIGEPPRGFSVKVR